MHPPHVTQITTDITGRFTIEGLDSGAYSLVEIQAPAGYNKLDSPVPVTIDSSGGINASETSNGVCEILVLNQTGAELPDTGDCGTTWFYILGSLILISGTTAAILLFPRKENKVPKLKIKLSEYSSRQAEEFYSVSDPRFPFHSDNHILTSKTIKQHIKLPGIRGEPN